MKKANQYREIEKKIQDIISDVPIRYAFGQEQFDKNVIGYFGFKSMDEAHEKLYGNGYGGYYLRTDSNTIKETWDKVHKMKEEAIEQDKDGTGYIYDMFYFELGNHEYQITLDLEPTIEACGLTINGINDNEILLKSLKQARADFMQDCINNDWF